MEEIQDILSSRQFVFHHIFRECNAGANFLPRIVALLPTTWMTYAEIPHRLKGILKLDKLGLPSLRF